MEVRRMNEEGTHNYWSPKRNACKNHQLASGFHTDASCSLGIMNPLWEVVVCQPTYITQRTRGFQFPGVRPSDQHLSLLSRWTFNGTFWKDKHCFRYGQSLELLSSLVNAWPIFLSHEKGKKRRNSLDYLSLSLVSHSYMSESSSVMFKARWSKRSFIWWLWLF